MYRLALTSLGGAPVSIELKEYEYPEGGSVEMIPHATGPTLDARFADEAYRTATTNFQCDHQPSTYQVTGSPMELEYTYLSPSGGEIIRRYTFYPDDYHFDLQLTVNRTDAFKFERSYWLFWDTPLGITEPSPKTDYGAGSKARPLASGKR